MRYKNWDDLKELIKILIIDIQNEIFAERQNYYIGGNQGRVG